MNTYALTLSYEGLDFSGFARQKDDHITTVQGTLEQALATVLRLDTLPQTICAGRTDAGVHALSQVVSFELPGPGLDTTQCGQIVRSLNALTPASMSVRDLHLACGGFSARFDAISREYRYYIFNEPYPPTFAGGFAWHVPQKLNLDALRYAADYLLGEHDFRSFCTSSSAPAEKNTVREITTIEVLEHSFLGEQLITIRIVGNAFLHSMVRIIVGTLCEVAQGKRTPDDVLAILAAKDRSLAGQTAPAQGLIFHRVEYPAECFIV
ncbi:MAG: tRNA pseudouridine(38-40) synthase TruA [Coriobacteriia bacterium]|nr:tRNA pseudouridine(38-40) synthase TruA [Coriobacteriia bacterium]MCL2870560.1 tRNA pseudouridine(38-40) synthase TruA [Coriobacteriia bacterium]